MVSSNTTNRVVIFGGGMAGVQLAKALAAKCCVTLVDPNDYFEVPMAAPRSLVRPEFADRSVIPYAKALPNVEFVQGLLVEMAADGGEVHLRSGTRTGVRGDVHVLCTGSHYANPLMRSSGASASERMRLFRHFEHALRQARRILIVGGGPIGVEVAGEISEGFPHKSITLLEGGPRLLAGTSERASQHAAAVLASRGVRILVGEKLESATTSGERIFGGGGAAITNGKQRIDYDLMVWCTGGRPNTTYMTAQLGSTLDDRGRIRVRRDLRVEGHDTLFALGDITNLDENKMAWHITGQVQVAVDNVLRVLRMGRDASRLGLYQPQTGNPKMAVTLGSRQGVVHLPPFGVIRSPFLTRKAKAEHMLVPKYRRLLKVD
jgi:NADH dehydrogenase FAD-containing subunit